jgi:hypothetical protein
MRRICLVPAMLVMLLAVVPGTASAQGGHGAPDFQDRFTEEFVDDDFCGTGASVEVVENTVANGWGLEGEDFFILTFRTRLSFTYGDMTIMRRTRDG